MVEHLQWLFTGTFVVMLAAVPLYGWVASRYPRSRFFPWVYLFFIASLLLFFALFRAGVHHAWVARAFFIWASVFHLCVVSVFWSFMADRSARRRRGDCSGSSRRAGNYAIMHPAREMLYVVLDREEKYKAKNFIDTVVYRRMISHFESL